MLLCLKDMGIGDIGFRGSGRQRCYPVLNWTLVDKNLLIQALAKFFLGVILLGLLIFLPAWSVHYWQGWLTSR